MTAQEVLQELTALARGNSKEKVRALALLSSHFGILDGQGSQEQIEERAKQIADQKIEAWYNEVNRDVEEYNRKAEANNRDKDKQFNLIVKRYQHNEEAVAALQLMFRVMKDHERVEEEPEPPPQPAPEVEIIPPQRRLNPSPAERLIQAIEPEIVEPEPQPCNHGNLDCYICDHIAATQRAWFG